MVEILKKKNEKLIERVNTKSTKIRGLAKSTKYWKLTLGKVSNQVNSFDRCDVNIEHFIDEAFSDQDKKKALARKIITKALKLPSNPHMQQRKCCENRGGFDVQFKTTNSQIVTSYWHCVQLFVWTLSQ